MKNENLKARGAAFLKNPRTRITAIALAIMLIAGCVIGSTIAWLTDTTDPIENTFTYGDIKITLTETNTGLDGDSDANTNTYKSIPGATFDKDPIVTVEKGSESCWLFVKVEESTNLDDFMSYEIADGWALVPGVSIANGAVYYRTVDKSVVENSDQVFSVLKNDKITVLDTVTKNMIDNLTEQTYPTIKFTAYAVQKEGVATAEDAWKIAMNGGITPTP